MMPTFLGEPFYPGGVPLQPDQVKVNGKTVTEHFLSNVDEPSIEAQSILKEYIIYYIKAPIFHNEFNSELTQSDLSSLSLDELIMKCLDYGIDPL